MNIEEARDIVDISKNEIESIERYLGFAHTRINFLGNFTPETYYSLIDNWTIAETPEQLKQDIQDFVNLYSAMYKESKKNYINRNLVRGTSNELAKEFNSSVTSFISTSTDENIAKSFAKYGDSALVHFIVDKNVPFLDPTPYKSEYSRNEHEIILAPFCQTQISNKSISNDPYTYNHYDVKVKKASLQSISSQDLETLQNEILDNFVSNLENIKEFQSLKLKLEQLDREYLNAQGYKDELSDILRQKTQAQTKYDEVSNNVLNFRNKLQTFLKGMCRKKELEIDLANTLVAEDRKKQEEERKKRFLQEEERKKALELEEKRQKFNRVISDKISKKPQNTDTLKNKISHTLKSFLNNDYKSDLLAQKFGLDYKKDMNYTYVSKLINQIQDNIQSVDNQVKGCQINQNTELSEIEQYSKNITPLLDGISYGIEISSTFPEIENLHKLQSENKIKELLNNKVYKVMQNAQIQKYLQERNFIEDSHIGIFGKLFGKDRIREEKLKNLDLKIKLAKSSSPETKEKYSVREILADMHIFADLNLGGQFSKEMQELYNLIKSTYQDKTTGQFSEKYIKNIASQKILNKQHSNSELPILSKGKPKIFWKTKFELEALKAENVTIQQQIYKNSVSKKDWIVKKTDKNSITLFEQRLAGIVKNTMERENSKFEFEHTFDLWN